MPTANMSPPVAPPEKGVLSSKTIVINALASMAVLWLRNKGMELSAEEMAVFYGAGNILLRLVTNTPVSLSFLR